MNRSTNRCGLPQLSSHGPADGLTQEGLAEICSVTRQTISNWENGKSYPDLETLVLISDTFDVSLDEVSEQIDGARGFLNAVRTFLDE